MNIILLTFSKVNNYGANLQCYALSQVLKQLGHSVKIMDYQLPSKKSWNPVYKIFCYIQKQKFIAFRKKYLPLFTEKICIGDDIFGKLPNADCFMVGSDQVWNPEITKGAGPMTYFFDFLPDDVMRVSYAASFGIDKKESFNSYPEVSKLLRKFNSVSVRENTGISLCEQLSGITPDLVVDPTLLLGSFSNFITKRRPDKLYTFFFNHSADYYSIARNIANITGSIPTILAHYKHVKGFTNIYSCRVEEWIDRIANAKFVVTDSFHCTLFSIIHHRDFVVFNMPGKSDRVATLLSSLGLENRLCVGVEDFNNRKDCLLSPIDYSSVDIKIEELRHSSFNYLKEALG